MAKKRTTKTLRTNLLQMTIPGPAYRIELMMKQVSEKSRNKCWIVRVGIFLRRKKTKFKMIESLDLNIKFCSASLK